MSKEIDERVVEIRFDNKQFEKNVQISLSTINKLKQSLNFTGATKGLDNIKNAAKNCNMSGLSSTVDAVRVKFSALEVMAVTALANIANSAINVGKKITSFLIDPLVEGGKKRALNIEQAKFQFEGLGIDVKKAMESASAAVKGTAYGLDEAAKAASQFGASGMKAGKEMTSALRAISGVAAMTSSSYEDISRIFTTVSGNGRLMSEQLLQLSSRGINAAATLAKHLGKTESEIRSMVTKGEISFKTFYTAMDDAFGEHATKANKIFTGALANVRAALARIGADVATPYLKDMRDVFNALIPVVDKVHEALGPLIKDISNVMKAASKFAIKKLKSADLSWISPSIKSVENISKSAVNIFSGLLSITKPIKDALTAIFPPKTAKQLTEFTKKIRDLTAKFKIGKETSTELKNTFKGLFAILDMAKQALSVVLDRISPLFIGLGILGKRVLSVTSSWGEWLVKLDESIKKNDTFNKAIQRVIDFFKKASIAVKEFAREVKDKFNLPDLETIKESTKNFIDSVREKFTAPGFELLHSILERIHKRMSQIGKALGNLKSIVLTGINAMSAALAKSNFLQLLQTLWKGVKTISGGIAKALGGLMGTLVEKLGNADFSGVLDIISGLSFGGIAVAISKFLKSVSKPLDGLQGIANEVTGILDSVRGCFEAFQTQLKAGTLLKIASAIGILAASILTMSLIDSDKLNASLGALTVMFTNLIASMAIFNKISTNTKGVFKNSVAMISMSVAVLILASALKKIASLEINELTIGVTGILGLTATLVAAAKIMGSSSNTILKGARNMVIFSAAIKVLASIAEDLSQLGWEELGKGLVGVGGLLAEVSLFLKTAKFSRKSISTAASIVILSSAIKILASTCRDFAQMQWEELGKGIASIAALLVEVAVFAKLTGNAKHIIASGIALVSIGAAMKIFASAIKDLAKMSWERLGKGLSGMAGALLAVTAAINFMPKNIVQIGTGLIAVSTAIVIMAHALDKMGTMDWETIAKGLTALGGSILILAAGLNLMTGTLTGSAAMLIAAGALAILTPLLSILGAMSWESIAKGLTTIAGAFTIIGVAGLVLNPLVPTILALGGAFALIGVGVLGIGAGLLAAGAGLSALAVGFTALATAGAAGATAIVSALTIIIVGIAELIPTVIAKIGEGLIEFCKVIAEGAPAIGKAVKAVVLTLVDVLVECVPAITKGALELVAGILAALVEYTPQIVDSVFKFLIGVLEGIARNLPGLTKAAVDVLMSFFSGIVDALSGIDTEVLLKGIVGIGLLSAIMLALSAVATLVPGAMVGVLGMGVIIAELALVLAAIGALAQIPGLDWLINEGGKLMQSIGKAIGGFIGGVVGGFMSGMSSSFPKIGTDLAKFMTNVQPFIKGAKTIDKSAMDGVKALTETIILLTAANILESLTSWLTGGSSMTKFAKELVPFGKAMRAFSLEVAGIDGKVVSNAAIAGKTLAEMASTLPNSGGVVGFFTGENDMSLFSEQLVPFGKAMKKFSLVVSGMDGDAVKNAATAGKAMAEMASTLPNSGGVVGFFTGENDMDVFGEQLIPFGKAMKAFSKEVKGLDVDAISNSAIAGKALAELADTVPNSGGVVDFFTGENEIDKFGEKIVPFGKAMKAYSMAVAGIDTNAIENSTLAGQSLVELANTLPNTGGVVSWFAGDNNIGEFGKSLITFGRNFSSYSGYMKNVDSGIVTATTNAANSIVELQKSLPKEGGWFSDDMSLSSFGSEMSYFGSYFLDYYNYISGINTKQLGAVIDETNGLVKMAKDMTTLNANGMSNFSTALTTLGQTGIDGFIGAFTNATSKVKETAANMLTVFIDGAKSKKSELTNTFVSLVQGGLIAFNSKSQMFNKTGQSLITSFVSGIRSKGSSVSGSAFTMISNMISNIRTKYTEFYNVASYLVDGFASGISANTYKAEAKSREMAAAAAKAAAKELDEHSPSKVGYHIGDFFGLAFVNAIIDYVSKAYKAGSEIANSAKAGLGNTVSKIMDFINNGIDASPTVRPVMDLSDIQNGTNQLYRLINGVNGYTVSGSIGIANIAAKSFRERQNEIYDKSEINAIHKLQRTVDSIIGKSTEAVVNHFYIKNDNPKEVAKEVSNILQRQKERRDASYGRNPI